MFLVDNPFPETEWRRRSEPYMWLLFDEYRKEMIEAIAWHQQFQEWKRVPLTRRTLWPRVYRSLIISINKCLRVPANEDCKEGWPSYYCWKAPIDPWRWSSVHFAEVPRKSRHNSQGNILIRHFLLCGNWIYSNCNNNNNEMFADVFWPVKFWSISLTSQHLIETSPHFVSIEKEREIVTGQAIILSIMWNPKEI